MAQWEREATGERTSAAMQHKATMGEFTGGEVPFGFRLAPDGVHLKKERGEQAVIAEAKRLRRSGLTYRAIAVQLGCAGFRSRIGKSFAAMQVRRMVAE